MPGKLNISSFHAQYLTPWVLYRAAVAASDNLGTPSTVGIVSGITGQPSAVGLQIWVVPVREARYKVASVAIDAAGSGYAESDTLTWAGDTEGDTPVVLTITGVGVGGEVETFDITDAGNFASGMGVATWETDGSGVDFEGTITYEAASTGTIDLTVFRDNDGSLSSVEPYRQVGESLAVGHLEEVRFTGLTPGNLRILATGLTVGDTWDLHIAITSGIITGTAGGAGGAEGTVEGASADYGGLAPGWTPTGGFGVAIDSVTERVWWYYNGQWN